MTTHGYSLAKAEMKAAARGLAVEQYLARVDSKRRRARRAESKRKRKLGESA